MKICGLLIAQEPGLAIDAQLAKTREAPAVL